jgi:ribosomal protein L34E
MKSFITGGLLVASLALIGNTAMAATLPAHKHAPVVRHIVQRLPQGQANGDIGQFFQSIFGGRPMQYSRLSARASRQSRGSYGGSPSYDSSPAVDTSSAATDSSNAEAQAMQSMNDENALNASTAAAEAQNEAAQAAAIQTEINANNQ